MAHFVKLWDMMLESTIWREPNDLIVLWIGILAKKGPDHIVRSTIPGLAAMAKISNEQCAEYIKKLESPDKWSGSQDYEGRRLIKVEGGWFVVNGEKYQEFMRREQRKAAVAKAVRRHREKKKGKNGKAVPFLGNVPSEQQSEDRMQRDLRTREEHDGV